jgi:uracil permease
MANSKKNKNENANTSQSRPDGALRDGDYIPGGKKFILGLQHVFTMFGSTVLVPILTGLNVSVALFGAGVGTLIFHYITKKRIPAFLGSSFAYIPVIIAIGASHGLEYAAGGLFVAGLLYILFAAIVKLVGPEIIDRLFPPIVTGPIIMVIGLNLAPTAISMASQNWTIALICLLAVTIVNVYGRGFIQLIPVLLGLSVGYIAALIFNIVDFAPIADARWFSMPEFIVAKFDIGVISMVAPLALVTIIEHIGDVLAIGATVEDEYLEDPGFHRTILADGIAKAVSSFIGGAPVTTYSENTGVLALTKVWNTQIMRIAAVIAIALSFIGKLGAAIQTIPEPVIGGISIILFGMIASIGVRTVVENNVDFKHSRNLIVASVILVLGIGGAEINIGVGNFQLTLAGMALAAIAGLLLNQILPKVKS